VAAGEQQPQLVVAHGAHLQGLVRGREQRGHGVPLLARRLTAEAVDGAAAGGRDDPAARVGRRDVPRLDRDDERVLDRVLGQTDVAEQADQRRNGAAVLGAEDRRDVVGHPP